MKRIIRVLDKEEMYDNLSIRSVILEKHSVNVFHTNTYHVVYEYSDTHRFIGDQFYKEENLPAEERKFYEESLSEPKPVKRKTSAKAFKNLIQQKFPDCMICTSNNYGDNIKVAVIKKDGIFAEEIFCREGTRQEILDDLGIE